MASILILNAHPASVTMKTSAPVTATFLTWCDGMAGGKVPDLKKVRSANRKRLPLRFSDGAELDDIAKKAHPRALDSP